MEALDILDKRVERDQNRGLQAKGLPWWKRALDLGFIVILSPGLLALGGLVALLVKAGSPGPVLSNNGGSVSRAASFSVTNSAP